MRTPALIALVVLYLVGSPLSSLGVAGPPERAPALTRGARALLDRGVTALDAKDLPAAGRLLTDAYRQSQRSEVLYQLGRLAVAEGRTLDAYDLMRRYLADPARETNEVATRDAEAVVSQPPPPSSSLTVLSDPGALVLLDERAVATLPLLLPLQVTPGTHTVKLEFPGKTLEAPVQAELGRLVELRMSRASGTVLVSVLPAILLADPSAGLPPNVSRLLAETIEQAAHDEQYTLLGAATLLPKGDESARCLAKQSCLRELASKNKLELLLEHSVEVRPTAAGQAWKFELRLVRVGITEPAAVATKSCDSCTPEQAAAQLKEAAAQLLTAGLSRPRGTLRLTPEPAAATLRLGDRALPPAPHSEPLWAGSYELSVSYPGYQTAHQTVEVSEGAPTELRITLQREVAALPLVPPPTGRAPRPRWRLALGGALLGVGLAVGIAGAVGIARDSSCAVAAEVPGDPCPKLYDTLGIGAASVAGGLLLMGTGGLLLALPGPRR